MSVITDASGRQQSAYAIVIAFPCIAVIVVLLRFYTRARIIRKVGPDDWLILIAMINSIGLSITGCMYIYYMNVGLHVWEAPTHNPIVTNKVVYANQMLYNPILATVKSSVLIFLYRLSPNRRFRQVNLLFQAINISLAVSIFFADMAQCTPISYVYDTSQPGHCIAQVPFFEVTAAMTIFTDILVLLMPAWIVWDLQMHVRQKLVVLSVLSLGGFVFIVGIVRLVELVQGFSGNNPDPTWSIGFVWSAIEVNTAIMSASIPALKPFVVRYFGSILGSSIRTRYGQTPNSQGRSGTGAKITGGGGNSYPLGSVQRSGVDNSMRRQATQIRSNGSEDRIVSKDMDDGIVRTVEVQVHHGDNDAGRSSGSIESAAEEGRNPGW